MAPKQKKLHILAPHFTNWDFTTRNIKLGDNTTYTSDAKNLSLAVVYE
jgi:hypothetical protein